MYTIHADGKLLFNSLSEDVESIVLSPKLMLDINKAGSLSLVLPPGNGLHGKLQKLKSILTVERDGEQIARARATETEIDIYNQQTIYCEGDKTFLRDSVFSPGALSGNVRDFFRSLISNHNSQVDAEKRFTVGVIDVVDANAVMQPDSRSETRVYWNTMDMIEDSLLNVYGGYLRTRTVGSTHYIDWVKEYGEANSQPIEFTVNLLDLTDKADAGDVFTVLIPLGASEIGDDGEYTDPLSIASVNNGLNYIQDDEAVAMYGKIWRTHTWSYIDDPAQLLAKGREYLKTGIALETLTLKAVDMHFTDGNIQPIRIGDRVRILSNPHGIDRVMVCSQIEIDLLNPENTLYTFGEPPRTLTDNFVKAEEEVDSLTGYRGGGGGGRKNVQEEISDIIRWAKINVDEANAHIQLTAGELDKTNKRLSTAEIDIDGVETEISIAARRIDEVEGRTTEAEIAIDGANARIDLQAIALEDLSGSVSNAEIAIDGLNAEIDLKVNKNGVISAINLSPESVTIESAKINLKGYVTASQLSAEIADVVLAYSTKLETTQLIASQASVSGDLSVSGDIRYGGKLCNWKTDKYVVTSVKYPGLARIKLSELSDSDYVVTGYNTSYVSYPGAVGGGNIDYLTFV